MDTRHTPEEKRRAVRNLILILIGCALGMWLLPSCSTKERIVVVTEQHHDTTYITKTKRDSIWQHDSILVKEKGDTVIIHEWHTKWRDILQIDTFYYTSYDTVPKPYPVEVKVAKPLTWWQRTQMYAGDALFLILAGLLIYGYFKFTT